jgi:hypothetical protein
MNKKKKKMFRKTKRTRGGTRARYGNAKVSAVSISKEMSITKKSRNKCEFQKRNQLLIR